MESRIGGHTDFSSPPPTCAAAPSDIERLRHPIRRTRLAAILVGMSLSACHTLQIKLPTPVRVKSQDKAATVLVTTSMVAPWANVSAALKPGFTMTGDSAVTEVLPTTEQVQSEALSAFGASLGVGLPGSSTSASNGNTLNTATGSNTSGGVTTTTASSNGTTTSSTTTTTTPGVAPTPPTGTPAGGALPTATAPTGTLGLDPILKYKGAAYLNQSVQLLNQEVDNAALRECFVPYVVKLKLAVMNYRPYLAYSVHTRVSFGTGSAGEYPPTDRELAQAAKVLRAAGLFIDIDRNSDKSPAALRRAAMKLQEEHTSARCLGLDHTPIVVPFLVADDMDVALTSHATEAAQQIALALNFMAHGIGGNAGVNNLNTVLTAVSSQDLSSVLTVARDNDNTLYIRIAPDNQASGSPSLVGQTYDVAVLLLVPRRDFVWHGDHFDPATISLVSYTQFRDADSGDILPIRPRATLADDLNRVLMPFIADDPKRSTWWKSLQPEQRIAEARGFLGGIAQARPDIFREYLKGGSICNCVHHIKQSLCFEPENLPALWAGLSSVLSDNSYKSALFEAPVPERIAVPLQTVLIADDQTHPIQALISGVSGMSSATLAAHLNISTTTPAGTSVIAIPAQSLSLDTTAHVLTVTFPSLGKSGLAMPKPPSSNPPKKAVDQPDTVSPVIVLGAHENSLVIERVNCDPFKALCPQLVGEDDRAGPQNSDSAADHPYIALPVQFSSIAKPVPTSVAKLASSGSTIVIDRGSSNGILPIVVAGPAGGLPPDDTLALTVTGAPVVAAEDASQKALKLDKNGYELPQVGAYTIQLANLTAGTTVSVSIQAFKSGGKTPDGDPATASFTAISPTVSRP